MSDTQYGEVGETLWLHFAANDTSGSGGDGSSAAAHVRLCGAAASAAPVYSPTPSLLSHASFPAGAYEVAIPCTTANGFADLSTYAVFCTLAIDAQNPTGFIGRISLGKLATQKDLGVLLETTVATLASQTSFTLTDGSDQDDQYNNLLMVVQDADNTERMERVYASNYTGATKTVTLASATGTFTLAVGDKVLIYPQLHEALIASAANLQTVDNNVDSIKTTVEGTVDANVVSQAVNVDANVVQVNSVTVTGAGTEGDPWGP